MTRIQRFTRPNTEGHHRNGTVRAMLSWYSVMKYRPFYTFLLGTVIGLTIAIYQLKFTKLSRSNNHQLQQYNHNATFTTVIIVLGEKLVDVTQPSENLKNRIYTAQEVANEPRIYHDASISHSNDLIHVIFSGGDTAQVNKTEASVMKELWEERDVANILLHLEHQSLSTCQNAYYSIPILQQIHQRHLPQQLHIILVTSDYHVARAKLLFEQVFQTVLLQQKNNINDTNIIQIDDVVGAPTMDKELRQQLFLNERRWLQPKKLEKLLLEMDNHPFQLPTKVRIQQAVMELDRHEKYEELN